MSTVKQWSWRSDDLGDFAVRGPGHLTVIVLTMCSSAYCPRHQAVLWCQEQGPWGWLRFAVHCYGSLGLLPFGLDAPSGAFFLLLLGLACSCHWDVWHWSFSTHRELCRVWVSWVFRSLPLTLGGASFSVKGTHTQTVMQDCSCVSDFLFRFFWGGGGGALYFLHLHFLTQAFGLIFADIVKYVACCLSSELVIDCVLVFFLFSFLYLNHWGTKRRADDGYMFKLATHGNQGKNSLVFVSVKINNSIQNCLQ